MGSIAGFIGLTILMIINLLIYHKIFRVIFYFDLGKGIIKEIMCGYFAAAFEVAVVMMLGKYLLGGIFDFLGSIVSGILAVIGWILKLILIIAAVAIIISLVRKIINNIKNKKEGGEVTEGKTATKPLSLLQKWNLPQGMKVKREVKFCAYCGKPMEKELAACSFCGKEKWLGK